MIFSSVFFLLFFLPLVLGVYYIINPKLKNAVLLIFSLIFYAWGEPVYIFLMMFSILFNYICGLFVRNRKWVLILTITGNLAGLFFFKYADFFVKIFNSISGTDISDFTKYIKLHFINDLTVCHFLFPFR